MGRPPFFGWLSDRPRARQPSRVFSLAMNLGHATFGDRPGAEIARILRELACRVEASGPVLDTPLLLKDSNGNGVGVARCG